jgi:hypothetical protein
VNPETLDSAKGHMRLLFESLTAVAAQCTAAVQQANATHVHSPSVLQMLQHTAVPVPMDADLDLESSKNSAGLAAAGGG